MLTNGSDPSNPQFAALQVQIGGVSSSIHEELQKIAQQQRSLQEYLELAHQPCFIQIAPFLEPRELETRQHSLRLQQQVSTALELRVEALITPLIMA